ncbi:MAG: ankyrin repeat domain-containing protein [Leptospiraceae bacterium]|nr:ankyrin repeat domain-containing protein [Leptospiraceae bacterium]
MYAFPQAISLLLEFDVDVNTQSEEGYTALHRAVIHHELESARILLRAKSDLTQKAWYRVGF